MRAPVSRRRFLKSTAAGLSAIALPGDRAGAARDAATAEAAAPDEFSVAAPVSIEVNARPMPSFDTRDRSRVRFGSLEYRSGLILTSRFRGFGGLSGLRLDAKGERFIAISDKGSWFTGRIVYQGREMTGLDDVEAAPMLGPDGRPITARGWFDSEVDRARRHLGLYRPRARQPAPALRFQQGLYPRARRGGAAAAGGEEAAVQQGAGSAGDGAEGPAAGGHADRDLRARPRCRRQPHRVSDRRPDAGAVQRSPHRQFRRQRRGAAALGRASGAGAEIFAGSPASASGSGALR